MSEENKVIVEEKCLCKSKFFRNFAAVTLGTFVGGFCAINLFAALNKPPMMPMMPMMHPYMGHHHIIDRPVKHFCDCPCHREHYKLFDRKFKNMPIVKDKKIEDKD